jgi:hypothetical protein
LAIGENKKYLKKMLTIEESRCYTWTHRETSGSIFGSVNRIKKKIKKVEKSA